MKCLHETVIWLLIPFLVLGKSYAVPTKNTIRNGKYMAFTAEDMFSDLLDDVQDPLAVAGTINEKGKFYSMNDTVQTTVTRPKINDTKMTKLPVKTEEKFALYNQDSGKYELITTTSGHFSFPMKPVTENGVFFYGGEHYQYRRPVQQPNKSEEIKIFWSAVGDAVENSPYFPIQINVPDMIAAMTNFFVNYIPFLNRLTNPNHPRLPYQVPERNHTDLQKQQDLRQEQQEQQHHPQQYHHPLDYYDSLEVYQQPDNTVSRREFILEAKSKERQKTKRKSNKKKNSQKSSSKGIFSRPTLRKTTSAPVEDTKIWHQFGSDTKETFRLKNMPITRKRVRVADREVFNFRNSDISNSPIMILNVPQRPIMHYRILHNEGNDKSDKNQTQVMQPQQLQLPQQFQLPQQIPLPQQQLPPQFQVFQNHQAQKQKRIRNSLQQTPGKPQKQKRNTLLQIPRQPQQQQRQLRNSVLTTTEKSPQQTDGKSIKPTSNLLTKTPQKTQQLQKRLLRNSLPTATEKLPQQTDGKSIKPTSNLLTKTPQKTQQLQKRLLRNSLPTATVKLPQQTVGKSIKQTNTSSKTPRKPQQQQRQIRNSLSTTTEKPMQKIAEKSIKQTSNSLSKESRKSQEQRQQQQQTRITLQQPTEKSQQQIVGKSVKQTKQTQQNRRKTNSKTKKSSKRTGRSDSEINEQTTGSKS